MIAGIAAIGAFIAAAVMLVLSGLGLVHARRTSPATEILSGQPANGGPRYPHHRRPTRPELNQAPQTPNDRGDSPAQGCHHSPFGIMIGSAGGGLALLDIRCQIQGRRGPPSAA